METVKLSYDETEILIPLKKPSLEVLDKYIQLEKEFNDKSIEIQQKINSASLSANKKPEELTPDDYGKFKEGSAETLNLIDARFYYETEKFKIVLKTNKLSKKELELLDKPDFWKVQDLNLIKEVNTFFRDSFVR